MHVLWTRILSLGIAVALLSGCAARVPLTKTLIKEYNLRTADLTRLQLYVSDGVLLEQQARSVDKNIDESYSLKKVEDQYVKQIHLRRGTPCVAMEASADKLRVAFEPTDQLTFVADPAHRGIAFSYRPDKVLPEPVEEERAAGSTFYGWKKMGTESYEDSTYNVFVRRALPVLLVDQASLKNYIVDSRTLPGMRQRDMYRDSTAAGAP